MTPAEFLDWFLHQKVLLTLVVVFLALTLKFLLVKWVRKRASVKKEDRRDLANNVKNFLNFLVIMMVLTIWVAEIQQFALSIAAFSVAIVLATREFIQCVIGFFYLVSTRPFRVGDWIQVGEDTGEVSATDWIKSTLLEVDKGRHEYTGKTLYIPNNKLMTSPIKNLNYLKRYASHHFNIVRDQSVNPYLILPIIEEKARAYCEEFYEVATRYSQVIERSLGVKIAGPEPHFAISTTELGDTVVEVALFCPTEKAMELENMITADFMNCWFEEKQKQAKSST